MQTDIAKFSENFASKEEFKSVYGMLHDTQNNVGFLGKVNAVVEEMNRVREEFAKAPTYQKFESLEKKIENRMKKMVNIAAFEGMRRRVDKKANQDDFERLKSGAVGELFDKITTIGQGLAKNENRVIEIISKTDKLAHDG